LAEFQDRTVGGEDQPVADILEREFAPLGQVLREPPIPGEPPGLPRGDAGLPGGLRVPNA
jgi:hypothetical protein